MCQTTWRNSWCWLIQKFHIMQGVKDLTFFSKPKVIVQGMKMIPCFIGDSIYIIHICLQKNWNSYLHHKKTYDNNMNSRKVIIENVFGSLKNWWEIFKIFNSNVNRAFVIVIFCCVYITIVRCEKFKIGMCEWCNKER